MKTYKFIISGKVQGVYYRKSISNTAKKSKFNGYVKNLSNGNVEAVVTCEENRLNEFISILKKGSSFSRVDSIKQSLINENYAKDFVAKY